MSERAQELLREVAEQLKVVHQLKGAVEGLEERVKKQDNTATTEEFVRIEKKFDEAIAEFDKKQKAYEKDLEISTFDAKSTTAATEAAAAMVAHMKISNGRATEKDVEVFKKYNEKMVRLNRKKDLIPDTTSGGIYVIPEPVAELIGVTARYGSYIRGMCTVRTATGQMLYLPKGSDVAVGWGQVELAQKSMTDMDPKVTRDSINIEELSAIGLFGYNELDDAMAAGENLLEFFQIEMRDKIIDTEENGFATGRGHTTYYEPNGFMLDSNITSVTAGAAAAISYDDLMGLKYQLDPRNMANAAWAMNNATFGAVRKLKDDNGMPIFMPSYNEREPMRLDGNPVIFNGSIDNIGASKSPIMIGDFKKYFIYDRKSLEFQILRELYSANNKIGLKVMKRVSGIVRVPSAFRKLTHPAS